MENNAPVIERRGSEDRRRNFFDIERRKFDRRNKEFLHEETVYLFDTNAVGNTYFAQHFIWQGKVREAFLLYIIDSFENLVRSGVKLITKEASCEYFHESVLFDAISMRLRVGRVSRAKIELLFDFSNKRTGTLISKGRQLIVFGGPSGRPIGIPEPILRGIKKFRRD